MEGPCLYCPGAVETSRRRHHHHHCNRLRCCHLGTRCTGTHIAVQTSPPSCSGQAGSGMGRGKSSVSGRFTTFSSGTHLYQQANEIFRDLWQNDETSFRNLVHTGRRLESFCFEGNYPREPVAPTYGRGVQGGCIARHRFWRGACASCRCSNIQICSSNLNYRCNTGTVPQVTCCDCLPF